MWLLALLGLGAVVWAGQQYILRQPAQTLWYSDPYLTDQYGVPGTGTFYTGDLPPGEAPPWRLASENEAASLL